MNQSVWSRILRTVQGATLALLLSMVFVAQASAAPVHQDADGGAVASLGGVEQAVVRVSVTGSFAIPGTDERIQETHSGSAFIYNALGYAYTNYHVVAGADTIQVRLNGEEEPRNASVIWASACDDLAVIDIDGSGFSYLSWYEGDLSTGTKIYAAGFPLGAYKPQMSQGVITGVSSDGDTAWSSMDSIVNHSADTYPGSSGGPLVAENGQVVGINFGGDLESLQSMAIPREIVQAAQQRMISGSDYMELGLAGQAVVLDDELSGILVIAVEDGSLAARTGIQPADFLVMLDGQEMATDGTMNGYCNIMESHSNNDALTVSIVRPLTEQFLEGTINGTALETVFSSTPAVETIMDTSSADTEMMDEMMDEMTDETDEGTMDEPDADSTDSDDSAMGETVTGTVAIVSVNRLNIRQCAGLDCNVVGTALIDQCYSIDMQEQVADLTWVRILGGDGAPIGWVASTPYSRAADSCPAAPVEETPAAEEPAAEEPAAEEAETEPAQSEEAEAENMEGDQAATEESTGEAASTEEAATEEAMTEEVEEAPAEEASAEETVAEEPAAEEPAEEPAAEETPTEEPAEEPAAEEVSVPATPAIPASNETCILFENFIGAEITVTFTNQNNGQGTTFRLTNMEQRIECFEAGEYTYTLDAPPPWGSTSGELKLVAGQHGTFPISGR